MADNIRVIRASGENVSPSDDARLFNKMFSDGLFTAPSINMLGSSKLFVSSMYGILQGRDFTTIDTEIDVQLPSSGTANGYVYIHFDTAEHGVGSIRSALAPFTPTVQDINGNGQIVDMVIADYTADPNAVESVTVTASAPSAGGGGSGIVLQLYNTLWSNTTVTFDGVNYYFLDVQLHKIMDQHPIVMIAPSGDRPLPLQVEQEAFNMLSYAYIDESNKVMRFLSRSKPQYTFWVTVKGVS